MLAADHCVQLETGYVRAHRGLHSRSCAKRRRVVQSAR
jgi:hypothetical protein